GLTGDVFHRHERAAMIFAHVKYDDNVGMPQASDGAGFARESLPQLLVVLKVVLQNLDRNQPVEDGIVSEIKRPHAAGTETALDFVSADATECHAAVSARQLWGVVPRDPQMTERRWQPSTATRAGADTERAATARPDP